MVGAALAATITGLALATIGGVVLVLPLALPVGVVVILRPQFGTYLFLFANPLIVGVARGDPIPLMRPNELLLLVLLSALAVRLVAWVLSGRRLRPTVNNIDLVLLAMAVAGSLLPLVWRELRGLPVSRDDILYSVVLWKYLALYWLFRQSITRPQQVSACLVVSMLAAVVVAIVAILQVTNSLGVPDFLYRYYDAPFTGFEGPITGRGTSTIASSFGTADVMIINLLIALALMQVWGRRRLWFLGSVAGLSLAGCLAAGAFSGMIGLVIALVAIGVITRQAGRLVLYGAPVLVLGMALLWPVLAGRLAGFASPAGLPQSWIGRWENLRDFFLPEIFSGVNWLTGVRPAARVPAFESWRDWVYIESGYVWLIWIGGLPFFLAFLAFVGLAAWHLWRIARHRHDAVGAAAAVSLAYLTVIAVLMALDPHLTIRGSADLFFPLLAVSLLQRAEVPGGWRVAPTLWHRGHAPTLPAAPLSGPRPALASLRPRLHGIAP